MKTRIVSSVTTTLLLGSILMNPVANAADSDI
ncbi:alpha-hemolysin, partial [Staphylococcus aureus]